MKREILTSLYKRGNNVLHRLCHKKIILAVLISPCARVMLHAQVPAKPVENEFHVISRKPLAGETSGLSGTPTDNPVVLYNGGDRGNKHLYKVNTERGNVSIEALTYVEYSKKTNRIVTYGDNLDKHVVAKAYVNIYSGDGSLVKSLGQVAAAPFAATLNDNGSFVIAGNRSQNGEALSLFLAKFDKNGNKQWDKKITDENPVSVYSSGDEKYISLVTFQSGGLFTNIQYYDRSGNLLFTDTSHVSVSAIEFLANDRVVVSTGTAWFLYDIKKGFHLAASGQLKGKTIGRYPITSDPSGKLFTIVSEAGEDVRIQAFDVLTGTAVAESVFKGRAFWVPYRLAEISTDGTIRFKTPQEQIVLKIKQ